MVYGIVPLSSLSPPRTRQVILRARELVWGISFVGVYTTTFPSGSYLEQGLKSFYADTRSVLQDIYYNLYNLFSGDVHANHLTVSYVRFRNPIGVNFYLSGCNAQNFLAAVAGHCRQFSFYQLENLCNWYHEVPAVSAVCSSDLAEFQEELNLAIDKLCDREKVAAEELSTKEKAHNLSQEEINLADWLRRQS